jgi:hypothetical protein
MPWPDFSELSFGYSFLREFERSYSPGGAFPAAPDFISQADEASLGYDVEAALEGAAPVFFQFKRSFVLTIKSAKEVKCGDFAECPLFRMHLREKNGFSQHRALVDLESSGSRVFYVTSQIGSSEELSKCYVNRSVVDFASALFFPSEIILPNYHEPHHVTFQADEPFFMLYSAEGIRSERRNSETRSAIHNALHPIRRSAAANREYLDRVVEALMSSADPFAAQVASRFSHIAVKASVLAFLVLDAQMTLYSGD